MNEPIATLDLLKVASTETQVPIHVEIACPRLDADGVWTCTVLVQGLDDKPRDVYGQDSLQALCLALRLVSTHLQCAGVRGQRLVYADGKTEFSVSNYFKAIADSQTEPSA